MAEHKSRTIINFIDLDEVNQELIKKAAASRNYSYSPYSKFAVGAALRTDQNHIYGGCNVESRVFSPSICAERTAVCKAVSEGHKTFTAIAVVAYQDNCFTAPCGVCREVLSEFGGKDLDVYMAKPDMQHVLHMKLSELLPEAFLLSF